MSGLSPAQRRVADLLGKGLTDEQIGHRLFVSRNTVKAHVRAILRELDAVDRAQAAAILHRESALAPFRALVADWEAGRRVPESRQHAVWALRNALAEAGDAA